jgi:hypothetical protein
MRLFRPHCTSRRLNAGATSFPGLAEAQSETASFTDAFVTAWRLMWGFCSTHVLAVEGNGPKGTSPRSGQHGAAHGLKLGFT